MVAGDQFTDPGAHLEIKVLSLDTNNGRASVQVHHTVYSNWSWMGGVISASQSRVAVSRNGDGRLEVFALGADGTLFDKWQTFDDRFWSDWGWMSHPPSGGL